MDEKVKLREIQNNLVRLIESYVALDKNPDWKVLQELVFEKSLASIERQILNTALSKDINLNELYKLQGEWAWAKQHLDINRVVNTLKAQLEDIKTKLQ
jgi:hypothetical protein